MIENRIKVLVVGDVFLDHYIFHNPDLSTPSLETGLKPIVGVREEFFPGAAGNVAKALSMLGAEVYLVGVVGDDGNELELGRALRKYGINSGYLVKAAKRATPVYTKFINEKSGSEDLPRLDIIPVEPIEDNAEAVIENIESLIGKVDAVVIEDQVDDPALGTVNDEVKKILDNLRKDYLEKFFLVDSRTRPELFEGYIVKPNIGEFAKSMEKLSSHTEEIGITPTQILTQRYLEEVSATINSKMIVTANEDGAYTFEKGSLYRTLPLDTDVVDICGAGDAFIAALTINLCGQSSEKNLLIATEEATKASGISISQPGTGEFTQNDLKKVDCPVSFEVTEPDIFRNSGILPGNVKYVLFDFDGTISILREGWQPIMKELMMEFIKGDKELDPVSLKEIEEASAEFISETTGIQTILQMEGLCKMVKEYGYVPEDKIKTAQEYKKVYTEKLKKIVKERMKVPDNSKYLLKGSLEFVKDLYNRGLTLLVASGTDRDDVIEEAKFVGIYDYMKGGVYGALKSYKDYSKEKIIKELLTEQNLKRGELVVIGDGPVEIAVGKEFGAFTIGVASNEIEGYGWNKEKFNRLKKVGADILIPDFSIAKELKKLLFDLQQL